MISTVSNTPSQTNTPGRILSEAERIRKVVLELIETERAYVKVKQL